MGAVGLSMVSHSHPSRDSSEWDNPDFCPFCGAELTNGGAGFIDHIDANSTCEERFERWRTQVIEDIGGEWGG